jgi:RsiW-degrading membrane proteinase PrsW (M82 family)
LPPCCWSAAGGWISAFGGAWKDAPSEGFQTLKFFRSPALAALFAAGLSTLTSSLLIGSLAATGFTVAATETYKTFFFPSKPRGKFAGMPVHYPEMLRSRARFVPLYVAIWGVVVAAAIGAARG